MALDLTGQSLDHFRIVAKLGQGGMGVVYKAVDEKLRRTVAVKVLREELGASEALRKGFLREARAAAGLTHPNIATVYEIGESEGRLFIAMEYVEGQTLRQLMGGTVGTAMDGPTALRVALQIARGLAKAHKANIVHRDLKPGNVLVGEDLHVKLLDFGLAKLTASSAGEAPPGDVEGTEAETLTALGKIHGTPAYMSPEQARGKAVDVRSDVFSFGVLLYEMVTGRRPFVADSATDILAAVVRDDPPRASSINPLVPAALDAIIARCMEKKPERRYASASAVVEALRELVPGAPASETGSTRDHSAGWDGTAPPAGRRLPRRWGLVALPVLLAALAAAIWVRVGRAVATSPDHADAAAPPVAAAPSATSIVALALPPSTTAGAVAAYRAGIQDLHDADWARANTDFSRAAELDPGMALAHLRLALVGGGQLPAVLRAEYGKAFSLRAALGDRDRTLLDAIEPLAARDPPDYPEMNARLKRALDRYPADAELWMLAGHYRAGTEAPEAVLRYFRRAVELDPTYADAWQGVANQSLRADVDSQEGRDALDRCLETAPGSTDCLRDRAFVHDLRGECPAMEADARRGEIQGLRVSGLYATGAPREAIEEVLRGAPNKGDPMQIKPDELRGKLDFISGNMAHAEATARKMLALVADDTNAVAHARPMTLLAQILLETGRAREADQVATDYLRRKEAWLAPPTYTTSTLLGLRRAAGGLDEEGWRAEIGRWLPGAKERVGLTADVWANMYGPAVATAAEARAAIALLPTFGKFGYVRAANFSDAVAGHVFLLAGEMGEATRLLTKATRRCRGLEYPFEQTRANLWLGEALETNGDKPGACAAYQVVLQRWGRSTPRSVTAEEARQRTKKLGCPK